MGTSQSQEEAPASLPPARAPRQPSSGGGAPSHVLEERDHSSQPHSSHHHSSHHHRHHHHRHHSPQSSHPHTSSRPHSSRHHNGSHHHNSHPLPSHVPHRPDYSPLDFSFPSLDRHVPRPRSASGGRRHRYPRLEDISSSAPSHSFLLFRNRSRVACPLCGKDVSSDEFEQHLVTCVSKPRVMYNVDTLAQDSGECSICLDDMSIGDEIARLPCLCVYHVQCLEKWYKVSQTCPEHPECTGTA